MTNRDYERRRTTEIELEQRRAREMSAEMEMEAYPACCDGIISKLYDIRQLREQIKSLQREVRREFVELELSDVELRALCKYCPEQKSDLAKLGLLGPSR
jgi:hypothetical protein